jgi:hypothetical protein
MKYLTFIRHAESYRQSGPPAALMEAMGKFVEKSRKEGILADTGGLDSKAEAVRIATEFMELHRRYWPEFEGESELRPMFDPGVGP